VCARLPDIQTSFITIQSLKLRARTYLISRGEENLRHEVVQTKPASVFVYFRHLCVPDSNRFGTFANMARPVEIHPRQPHGVNHEIVRFRPVEKISRTLPDRFLFLQLD
jgi:hypothetical protein